MARAWRERGTGMSCSPRGPGRNEKRTRSGRGPDAGRTAEFKETDADRTRTGSGHCRLSQGPTHFSAADGGWVGGRVAGKQAACCGHRSLQTSTTKLPPTVGPNTLAIMWVLHHIHRASP
eukprot:gene12405-biopygen10988